MRGGIIRYFPHLLDGAEEALLREVAVRRRVLPAAIGARRVLSRRGTALVRARLLCLAAAPERVRPQRGGGTWEDETGERWEQRNMKRKKLRRGGRRERERQAGREGGGRA
jgi:hypothetical protein